MPYLIFFKYKVFEHDMNVEIKPFPKLDIKQSNNFAVILKTVSRSFYEICAI